MLAENLVKDCFECERCVGAGQRAKLAARRKGGGAGESLQAGLFFTGEVQVG